MRKYLRLNENHESSHLEHFPIYGMSYMNAFCFIINYVVSIHWPFHLSFTFSYVATQYVQIASYIIFTALLLQL